MASSIQSAELRREALRRGIVAALLERHAPYPITDRAALVDCQTRYPELDFTLLDMQRIFYYLSGHGLAVCDKHDQCWAAKITAAGMDYLDGIGDKMPGVSRR